MDIINKLAEVNPLIWLAALCLVYFAFAFVKTYLGLVLATAWLAVVLAMLISPNGRQAIDLAASQAVASDRAACLGQELAHLVPLKAPEPGNLSACRLRFSLQAPSLAGRMRQQEAQATVEGMYGDAR